MTSGDGRARGGSRRAWHWTDGLDSAVQVAVAGGFFDEALDRIERESFGSRSTFSGLRTRARLLAVTGRGLEAEIAYVRAQHNMRGESSEDCLRTLQDEQIEMLEMARGSGQLWALTSAAIDDGINRRSLLRAPVLDDADETLAARWVGNRGQTEVERMRSARAAEKAFAEYFSSYGYEVVDTSIGQLSEGEQDWHTHDLLVAGHPIDVKNSRAVRTDKLVYTSHCVPSFKEHRGRGAVQIAGTLSSLFGEQSHGRHRSPQAFPYGDWVRVLGLTGKPQIERLAEAFADSPMKLALRQGLDGAQYLPPWLFEFPRVAYEHRNDALNRISKLELAGRSLEPIRFDRDLSALIAAGRGDWREFAHAGLRSEEMSLLNRIAQRVECAGLTLATVVLALLEHLVTLVRDGGAFPARERVEQLLYPRPGKLEWPLLVFDPLRTVNDLIVTMGTVLRSRRLLEGFDSFELRHLNVLRGREAAGGASWRTIIAYCGGSQNGKRCGTTPLVVGRNVNCLHCGYLICVTCGTCSRGCGRLRASAAGQESW